jgi:hypothetical protein
MKTAFVGILNNPSTSLNSHSAGWNEIVRRLTDENSVILNEKDNWLEYDRLIINHGPNFREGSFNMIGGMSFEIESRIKKLIECKQEGIEILQYDGFQMKDFLTKRKLNFYWSGEIEKYTIQHDRKLLLGDSHSISVWPGTDYTIHRLDGKTLYGFLKNPYPANYLYFGNIDIRFHLCRQPDPEKATIELVKRYINFAKECRAKVSCLLPVEFESRKIPTTGMYKGKKFYGSRELRSKLVNLFNYYLIDSGLEVNVWPHEWYTNIEHFEKEVMEPKQSVHLRPKYYASRITHLQSKLF